MYVVAQFKNKWDKLKKDWKLWKELKRGETGLGWDPAKRTIDASQDWWKERLQVVPAEKKFHYSDISPKLEGKIFAMFSEVVASGDHAWAPNSRINPSSPENVDVDPDDDMIDDQTTPRSLSDDQRGNEATFERGGSSKGRKRMSDRGKQSGARKIRPGKYNIDNLVESTVKVGEILLQPHIVSAHLYSIHEVIEEMERHPEICADPILFDFATILFMDSRNRELFLSLPSPKRV